MKGVKQVVTKHGIAYEIRFRYVCLKTNKNKEFRKQYFLPRKEALELRVLLEQAAHAGKLEYVLEQAQNHSIHHDGLRNLQSPTVTEISELWYEQCVLGINNKRQQPLSPSIASRYRYHLDNHILPLIGHIPITQLTADMIEQKIAKTMMNKVFKRHPHAQKEQPYSPGTMKITKSVISAFCSYAIKKDYLMKNPATHAIFPKVFKKPMRFWSIEQADVFLAVAQTYGIYWETVFFMFLRTGMRLGEVFGLDVSHVVLGTKNAPGKITVCQQVTAGQFRNETKWGITKYVDIDIQLQHVLTRYLRWHSQHYAQCKWLFPNDQGKLIKHPQSTVQKRLTEIAAKANVPHLRIHELRHSRGTQLSQAGVMPHVISQQLGHTDIKTTMNYLHVASGAGTVAAQQIVNQSSVELGDETVIELSQYQQKEHMAVVDDERLPKIQEALLYALMKKPLCLQELTKAIACNYSRVLHMVKVLEKRGLIKKERIDGNPYGVKEASLTQKGMQYVSVHSDHDVNEYLVKKVR